MSAKIIALNSTSSGQRLKMNALSNNSIMTFKASFEELLAWLRQPRCSGLSGFQWNSVIPASTESQIDRGSGLDL